MAAFEHRTYATRTPPLKDGCETTRHRVAIAGGGPVGLAVALALAKHGVPSLVLEADRTVCHGSRAICISRRSLEILDRLGVLQPFLDKGLPWTAGRSFYRDTEVLRFEMPHDTDQRLAPMTNIEQYYIEQFLVDEALNHPDLIELRWGTRVARTSPTSDGVALDIVNDDGAAYRIDADWLVACDGARSQVRQDLGLKMRGMAYEGRYVIVDIELDIDWPTERLAWFDPPSNPGRTMLMHKQPDNIWRLDYQLHDGEDAEAMIAPEQVVPVVTNHLAMLGITAPWTLLWTSTYRASALSLDEYVHGRMIFAGDAAHLVPIFGVRGLNSGFDDAFNLGWKLAAILRGDAPAALLETYGQERRLAWQVNVTQAMKSTEFMAPPSRGFELGRAAVLSLAAAHPALRSLINPRQSSVIDYEHSPLSTVAADESDFGQGPKPGQALPECLLADRNGLTVPLTRLLDDRFTLLGFGRDAEIARIAEAAVEVANRGLPLSTVGIMATDTPIPAIVPSPLSRITCDKGARFAELYEARPGTVYLIRPDGHVAGRWRAPSGAAIVGAIERALGHRDGPPVDRRRSAAP